MGFLSAFMRLTRFEHAVMLAIAVLIGEIIALGAFPSPSQIIVLSLLVPIFSEMGSFALNDYLDVESDRINKRKDRPLVSSEISPKFAFYFSWFALAFSTLLAFFINFYAFAIALLFNALAIAYNYKLKDLPLVGNIYIGLTMAIPFIFGSAVVLNSLAFSTVILSLFAIAFIAGVAREIVKSVEDTKGDRRARRSKTLPLIIGKSYARVVACITYLIFVPLTILPFVAGMKYTLVSLILVGIADVGIIYVAYLVYSCGDNEALKTARKLSLLCLFIGLIGFLLASLSL